MLSPEMLVRALIRGRKSRYDKGWVPGPNAEWKRKSPDEHVKTLRSNRGEEKKLPEQKTELKSPGQKTELKSSPPKDEAKAEPAQPATAQAATPEKAAEPTTTPQAKPAMASPDDMASGLRERKPKIDEATATKIFNDNYANGNFQKWISQAVASQAKKGNRDLDQVESLAGQAIWNAAQGLRQGEEGKFENYAKSAIKRAVISEGRKENALKRGGEEKIGSLSPNMDVAKEDEEVRTDDLNDAIGKLSDTNEKMAAESMLAGQTVREFAQSSGMNVTAAHRLREATKDRLRSIMSADAYQKLEEKLRYAEEREKERFEYGPRHQPPKRIEGAVARLEALRDFCKDIDDDALEQEVENIAREFSADDLKEVAKGLGIESGLSSKWNVLKQILETVFAGKE